MTARREASVRRRLLQLATLPFLLLLPALLYLIYQWGIGYYDRLLTFKVSSDLAVAHQYFNHVIDRVGQDVSALGGSHDFAVAAETGRMDELQNLLAERKAALGMDFLHFTDAAGRLRVSATGTDPNAYAPQAWPVVLSALRGRPQTAIDIFSPTQLAAMPIPMQMPSIA